MKIEDMFWYFLNALQHNEHYTEIHIFGKTIKACSRCLGTYLATLISFPFLVALSFVATYDFWFIFGISWVLASFAIIDWSSTKLGLRKGNGRTRIITGYMLGISGMIYLCLMPIHPIIKLLTLWGYGFVFAVIHYGVLCKEHNLSLRNPIKNNLAIIGAAVPLTVGEIGCGQTGGCGQCCTCCPAADLCGCCLSPIGLCIVGICPTICLMKYFMDRRKTDVKQISR